MGKKALVTETRKRRPNRGGFPNSWGKVYHRRKEREETSPAIRGRRNRLIADCLKNPHKVAVQRTGRAQHVMTAIDCAKHVNKKMRKNFSPSVYRKGLGPRRDVLRKVRQANEKARSRQRLREMQEQAGVGP